MCDESMNSTSFVCNSEKKETSRSSTFCRSIRTRSCFAAKRLDMDRCKRACTDTHHLHSGSCELPLPRAASNSQRLFRIYVGASSAAPVGTRTPRRRIQMNRCGDRIRHPRVCLRQRPPVHRHTTMNPVAKPAHQDSSRFLAEGALRRVVAASCACRTVARRSDFVSGTLRSSGERACTTASALLPVRVFCPRATRSDTRQVPNPHPRGE